MPQEVFDLWIAPQLEAYGWAFTSDECSLKGTSWQDFFASRSLREWAVLEWRLVQVRLSRQIFHPDTSWRIDGIIGHCVYGLNTDMANLDDTKERFRRCADFIRENGRLPAPVIGVPDFRGLELVDGHHRIAALFYVGIPTGFQIPVWVGISENS